MALLEVPCATHPELLAHANFPDSRDESRSPALVRNDEPDRRRTISVAALSLIDPANRP